MWNQRAKLLGGSLRSVMEQSFPHVVNEAIHAIHVREIIRAMPEGTREVLDVGCGWGRIASDIVTRKRVHIIGIDVSSHFVKLFNKRLQSHGKAIVGDMRRLPFNNNSFDLVCCVVSLMYLFSNEDQIVALSEMLRVLKKEGRLVLIEPNRTGVAIVRLGGLIPFIYRTLLKKKKVETHGTAFTSAKLQAVIEESGGELLYKSGYPFLTLFLLPILMIGRLFPSVARVLLICASSIDRLIPFADMSYFVTWVIRK